MGGKFFFKWTEPQVTGTIIQDLINICVTEIPRENECKAENIFEEIIVENFTNLIKDINVQIQKICRRLLFKTVE